jgi:GT2 family glycosyltransferase
MMVSIVTIAWRNERYAADFASSLARAVERAGEVETELVVVVNGPEGEAAGAAVTDACRGTPLTPVIVHLGANTGFSGGADEGVARTTGEIVVVANLDLTFDAGFLDGLGREAGEAWDLLAPGVVQGAHDQETGVSRRTGTHRLAWASPVPSAPVTVGAGNGACLVLRRSALERRTAALGALFDPEYHSFNEDIDLFWWAERAGLAVRYAPGLQVRHALAGSFGEKHRFVDRPPEIQRRVMANYRITVWKNADGPGDWLGLAAGEAQYLAQALVSRGFRGTALYAASWVDAVRTARAIRTRRGRLRPPVTRPV